MYWSRRQKVILVLTGLPLLALSLFAWLLGLAMWLLPDLRFHYLLDGVPLYVVILVVLACALPFLLFDWLRRRRANADCRDAHQVGGSLCPGQRR
jgi:hypothetical protein